MAKKDKKLVIVESPAKARTLKKYLGPGFEVEACSGHIRDLPPKSIGIKIEKDFTPNYKIIKGKEKIIKALQKSAKSASTVFLAPDPDREGEAIAWHLKYLLGDTTKIKRIEFHEITKEAVINAVKHPREIDMPRVNAQQARRILDRLVGYKISPLLWKKVRKGLSAGRVQSVAVRLICEREEQINAFKPTEYWDITASLSNQEKKEFKARLIAKSEKSLGCRPNEKGQLIKSEAEAKQIVSELEGASYQVSEIKKKEQKRYPAPPFITSTMQQDASRKIGFSSKKTMVIAQKLYENGHITYMRTDSVRIAKEAKAAVRKYITDNFGKEFLPESPIAYKKKKQAQDAHEAIRPTQATNSPDKIEAELSPDEQKLYDLIWKRFVACQMMPAIFDQTSVDITAKEYKFRSTGSVLKFEGFIKVYIESEDEDEKEGKEQYSDLPQLSQDEILELLKLDPAQHFTQPPPRYNEASLVKELEKRGIGRPSTYAPIISTVQDRGYVEKEGRALKPTEIGITTNGLLVKHFPRIMDIKFTAHMEDDLDDIVADKIKWTQTLEEFYGPFAKALATAEVKMEKVKKEIQTDEKCPECGKPLVIRQGRYGDFIACSGYPKCKFTKQTPEEEKRNKEIKEKCEKCGGDMIIKHGRFGTFLACSNYPKCKNVKSFLKKIGVQCPKCGGEIVERRTRKRRVFYGCINYPKCDYATWKFPKKEEDK